MPQLKKGEDWAETIKEVLPTPVMGPCFTPHVPEAESSEKDEGGTLREGGQDAR